MMRLPRPSPLWAARLRQPFVKRMQGLGRKRLLLPRRNLMPLPLLLLALVMAIGPAGCVTSQKQRWTQRVGQYTYDDAVKELGPPERKETTSDGTLVAEWVLRRVQTYGVPSVGWGMGWGWRGRWAMGWGGTDIHSTPEVSLQLHFGPDKRLQSWKEVLR